MPITSASTFRNRGANQTQNDQKKGNHKEQSNNQWNRKKKNNGENQ